MIWVLGALAGGLLGYALDLRVQQSGGSDEPQAEGDKSPKDLIKPKEGDKNDTTKKRKPKTEPADEKAT